ncbi:MAG TPA: hypothetical protein PKA29_03870 [Candidatus Saccharibacteria bacterium]|jgi:hypothetical protein|nr:hypothetical protein [Candidatus Saccharibacteria bacterium]
MQSDKLPYQNINYSHLWIIIAFILLVLLMTWVTLIFAITRKRHLKPKVDILSPQAQKAKLEFLQKKYLNLINETETLYRSGELNLRVLNQKLSLIIRFFAYEASGFEAHVLTLLDIKKSEFSKLSEAINHYYPTEFSSHQKGSAEEALRLAREVVIQWS